MNLPPKAIACRSHWGGQGDLYWKHAGETHTDRLITIGRESSTERSSWENSPNRRQNNWAVTQRLLHPGKAVNMFVSRKQTLCKFFPTRNMWYQCRQLPTPSIFLLAYKATNGDYFLGAKVVDINELFLITLLGNIDYTDTAGTH